MAQTAVYLHNQTPDEAPAHRISRGLALSFLDDGHAKREGEGIRLREGRSLQSLKAEYRGRPQVQRSAWIPETLPPAEVEGVKFQDPARKIDLFAVRGRSVLIRLAREFCEQV